MSKKKELTQEQIDAQARKAARDKRDADYKTYKNLVDFQVEALFPHIEMVSQQITAVKKNCYKSFDAAVQLKRDLYGSRVDENESHRFTNEKNDKAITIGNNYRDEWDDTVTAGIDLAKQRVEELAVDDNSRALVKVVLQLLSKNAKGELKASKILQLRKIAIELDDQKMMDAVDIIERAHRPSVSATYIIAEKKNAQGKWVKVPLSATSEV
jgi:hypothetical protein